MDLPNTGAVFTLGRSHLAENTQSYFYIKNDPIKRLISGPHQSAVICETGRLFVWGENHYGQLGVGGEPTADGGGTGGNNNKTHSATTTTLEGIVTKPTCVKSLKALGLKIADIAYGTNWSVILTHSNELFFTGRSIFPRNSPVARNFTNATVDGDAYDIIRKPFRLEEFDDFLSKSEETENYVSVMAGNEHFAAMTSFGRLIGWGSNMSYQLGSRHAVGDSNNNNTDGSNQPEEDSALGNDDSESLTAPREIILDSPITRYVCGPESTLVLTASGSLYLTGRLNEFVFSQFTELQKNLAPNEEIIYMHISMASEIFIITNSGSIYRSIESVRNKSLIFQRFYDYDSEENGPIWKLLKGYSFYVVLTKANKFYTTFSESGHHLKTFREISKFKNLRLLDMAVGAQHIIVHGIPRSSTLSASVHSTAPLEHRFMSHTYVMNGKGLAARGASALAERSAEAAQLVEPSKLKDGETETPKPNSPVHEKAIEAPVAMDTIEAKEPSSSVSQNGETQEGKEDDEEGKDDDGEESKSGPSREEQDTQKTLDSERTPQSVSQSPSVPKHLEYEPTAPDETDHNEEEDSESPVHRRGSGDSSHSRKSTRSIRFAETSPHAAIFERPNPMDKLLRPRTPYPDSSSPTDTPQTAVKKTPLRNFSYEAAMDHQDTIEHTSPALLVDSLDSRPGTEAKRKMAPLTEITAPTPPFDEDEQLTVEIKTTTRKDELDQTVVVNEIRFINNGIDVTDNVAENGADTEDDDADKEEEEEGKDDDDAASVKEILAIEKDLQRTLRSADRKIQQLSDDIEKDIEKRIEKTEMTKHNIGQKLEDAADSAEAKVLDSIPMAMKAASGMRDSVESTTKHVAAVARDSVQKAAAGARDKVEIAAKKAATDVRDKVEHMATEAGNKVEHAATEALGKAEHVATEALGKAEHAATEARDKVEHVATEARDTVENAATGARDAVENAAKKAANGARDTMENAAKKAANGARDAVESVEAAAKRAVNGARETADNVGENAKRAATDAKQAVDSVGNNAMRMAGGAKNAVGNVFYKMADGTKDAVDNVASKISNEVGNLTSLLQGKNSKVAPQEEAAARRSGAADYDKAANGEDDERTTASVNSNQTSVGNPSEMVGHEPDGDADSHVSRTKRALQEGVDRVEERVDEQIDNGKSRMRQFLDSVRDKGKNMSCRNERAIKIEDEAPSYTVEPAVAPMESSRPATRTNENTSKICSIL